jgi:hypothetical protein
VCVRSLCALWLCVRDPKTRITVVTHLIKKEVEVSAVSVSKVVTKGKEKKVVCVRACQVYVCVRACVRACVCVCVPTVVSPQRSAAMVQRSEGQVA